MKRNLNGLGRYAGAFMLAAMAATWSGCAPVNQKPFVTFAQSAQTLHDNSDKILATLQTTVQDRYVADLMQDTARVEELRLVPDSTPFTEVPPATAPAGPPAAAAAPELSAQEKFDRDYLAWEKARFTFTGSGGLALQMATFRAGMEHMNQGLVDYSQSLQAITDPKLIDDAGLTTLATDANANLRAGRDTLKLKSVSDQDVAIFTTVGVEAFRLYLQHEQRQDLLDAMKAAQPQMVHVSVAGREACAFEANQLWDDYTQKFNSLKGRITGVPLHGDKAAANDDERKQLIVAIISMNQALISTLGALEGIHGAYLKLPEAHEAMIEGVENNELSLAGLAAFLSEIKRIDSTYESLKGAPSTPPSK